MRPHHLRLFVLCLLMVSTSISAWAETREECMRNIGKHTNLAVGMGTGGVTGGAVGMAACSGFLATVIFDWGVSYATCVAAATAVGSIAGTALAESHNNTKEAECDKLPRHN